MINRDQILTYVQQKGPVLPSQLVGVFKTNTILIGATLSELAHAKKLFISHAKIGSSPVYYTQDQRSKLGVLYKHLNEKDRKTYDLLSEGKVLRESDQTPLVRVSLRNIKDFSVPLEVVFNSQREMFWKWYLTSNEEASFLIKGILGIQEKKKEPVKEVVKEPVKEVVNETIKKEVKEVVVKKETPEVAPEPVKVVVPSVVVEGTPEERIVPKINKEVNVPTVSPQKSIDVVTLQKKKEQQDRLEKPVVEKQTLLDGKKDEIIVGDSFHDQISQFFSAKGIIVEEASVIRKGKDIEYIIDVPSPLGSVRYFCKAKSKKKVNDGDLSSIYLTAEMKKLPALFLTTGVLTKKAEAKLEESLKNMKVVVL